MRTIGICCVGSGVGQSVIRSLNLSRLPIRTVGFGTNPFAFGAYECDTHDFTPSIYDDGYVDALLDLCRKHGVELLIPGLDDEVLLLSRHRSRFEDVGVKVLCASEDIVTLCRDKERACTELGPIADVFVRSYAPDTVREALADGSARFPMIAKPRSGFASRGVEILLDEADLDRVGEGHIIQELAVPRSSDPNHAVYMAQIGRRANPQISELSIQLVFGLTGNPIGRMASIHTLHNGVPIEVLPYDDPAVWEVVDRLTPELLRMGLRGPINFQGRLTDMGLRIFEINPRFTGITGLRALMGFNEVEACVKDWLGMGETLPSIAVNAAKFGMRQTLDMAVPIQAEPRVKARHAAFGQASHRSAKHLFITGASGYLGRNLIHALRNDDRFLITAFGRDLTRLQEAVPAQTNLRYADPADVMSGRVRFGGIDVLLHMGSARPHHNTAELAESTRFATELLTQAAMNHVPAIVNLSSQSVYGSKTPPLWTEDTPVDPMIPYAQSKYAVEQVLASLSRTHPHLKMVSIRMGSVTGGAPGMLDMDVICKMTLRAISGQPLVVTHPEQMVQRIDIRDAVDGVLAVVDHFDRIPSPVLNMTSPWRYHVTDIARMVAEAVARITSTVPVPVVLGDREQAPTMVGMSSQVARESLGWEAQIPIQQSIESVIGMVVGMHSNGSL